MTDLKKSLAYKIKQFLWDLSGAFGDIGVLFPLAIALIAKNGFNPTALFLMAGLFYITAAYYFKITMPVQPLKAMSAIAIASGLNVDIINGAGIVMGIVLIIISLTGVSVKLGKISPVSVIRGIQMGLGMMLIKASVGLMNADIFIALLSGVMLIASVFVIKKIPPLMPIMILGIILSVKGIEIAALGPVALTPGMPTLNNLWAGLIILVLPQIALTFGNAIVATEATGKILYGDRAARLNLITIPISMGLANIIAGIIGGAPMCHGSGGLTAHCKFGATSERSGYIIGFLLIALAILFGSSALPVISSFPKGILGVLLCYVGIQHSLFIKDILHEKQAIIIALTVAILSYITNNLTAGFFAGIVIHHSLKGFVKLVNIVKK